PTPPTPFPYTTLFRSERDTRGGTHGRRQRVASLPPRRGAHAATHHRQHRRHPGPHVAEDLRPDLCHVGRGSWLRDGRAGYFRVRDRKSTRLNSSHVSI